MPKAKRTAKRKQVLTWEDDPLSAEPCQPVLVPAPRFPAKGLTINIQGAGVHQPGRYPIGTDNFRYWVAYEALNRGLDFWCQVFGEEKLEPQWQRGDDRDETLPVRLNGLVDLNAYYDRTRLDFGHKIVSGDTIYTGESPDIICHELGHAVLDSIRPALFDAESDEVAAFHEAFADISAMLSTLQLQEFRVSVLEETEGRLQNTSRLSRFAEQLGAAIRTRRPDTVEPDCLRNAANSFFYADPRTLPPTGPAVSLSSAPHSFSRVFSGAFLEVLAGMLQIVAKGQNPTEAELQTVVHFAGRMIAAAVRDAEFQPAFFAPVARSMIAYDEETHKRRFRSAILTGFTRKGVLEVGELLPSTASPTKRRSVASEGVGETLRFDGRRFGLKECEIVVRIPAERTAKKGITEHTTGWKEAAESFLTNLFRRGRVGLEEIGVPLTGDVVHPPAFLDAPRSHILRLADQSGKKPALFVARRFFDI